jgi:Na+-transporting NADH:ubiquinone oxidoreductase subunit B
MKVKDLIEKKHDEVRHLFEKGGKHERLFPLFEAQDTFALTPPDVTTGPTHVRDAVDLKRVMFTVVVALIPCLIWGIFNAGSQFYHFSGIEASLPMVFIRGLMIVMPIILTSYIVGGLWEVLFCVVRKHEINEGFLVTGLLFPLTLPPTIALWQVAVGITFGVVIGKEIFGGTGYNILNPALTARAYLFFAHAKDMTGDVWAKMGHMVNEVWVDGKTGATPLSLGAAFGGQGLDVKAELAHHGFTFGTMFFGLEPGSIGETAAIPILLGAAILIVSGVGSWRIMAGGVLGLAATAILMTLMPTTGMEAGKLVHLTTWTQIPWFYHFVMGSFLFGIVFMATDPVSAAATDTGKWIYGILIGMVTVLVRVTNPGFPEGVMLAILFMNVMAPILDYYVIQGHIRKRNAYLKKFSYAKG